MTLFRCCRHARWVLIPVLFAGLMLAALEAHARDYEGVSTSQQTPQVIAQLPSLVGWVESAKPTFSGSLAKWWVRLVA